MRISHTVIACLAAVSLVLMVDGCSRKSTPSTGSRGPAPTSSTSAVGAHPSDYAKLLIQATDIDAPEPFTAGPPTNNPDGQPGVATTFSTQDGIHVIKDTIQVLADRAAATNALNAAKAAQGNAIKHPQRDLPTSAPAERRSWGTHRTTPRV